LTPRRSTLQSPYAPPWWRFSPTRFICRAPPALGPHAFWAADIRYSLKLTRVMNVGPWNWLELVKLAVGIMTPLSVAAFGWFISRRLKRFELLQWSNQKLIEKRIAIYDQVGPALNQLYCFYAWVGNWKETTPAEVLRLKRDLDQKMYVYGHLFDGDLASQLSRVYAHPFSRLFRVLAKMPRSDRWCAGPDGDRSNHTSHPWHAEWEDRFATSARAASLEEVQQRYDALIREFSESWGVRE
jgi:hypothetical protein